MKKKLLAVAITLVLMLGSTVPVFAGSNGLVHPPPVPTTLGLCITELPLGISMARGPGGGLHPPPIPTTLGLCITK